MPSRNDAQNASLELDSTDLQVAVDLYYGRVDELRPARETVVFILVKTVRDFYCTQSKEKSLDQSGSFREELSIRRERGGINKHRICLELEFVVGVAPLMLSGPAADEAGGVCTNAEAMSRISPSRSRCMNSHARVEYLPWGGMLSRGVARRRLFEGACRVGVRDQELGLGVSKQRNSNCRSRTTSDRERRRVVESMGV